MRYGAVHARNATPRTHSDPATENSRSGAPATNMMPPRMTVRIIALPKSPSASTSAIRSIPTNSTLSRGLAGGD